ncbi:hypothetical protein RHS01_09346 [Rhizoctonia solani]|uniref:Uncharacterized protein n=1 Tax=Rhizoctonia solani TaxID=456999 RepID=A0A8H7I558_9AGAM|nr:hypothetical protein RHS01_09346 [Rhizoctonia solani]
MPQRIKLPNPIDYIYRDNSILPENHRLDTKEEADIEEGQVQVRALNYFIFEKNGKMAFPYYGVSDEWWKDVVGFGLTIALTGDFKYHAWAGAWDDDYLGKNWEVIILGDLTGISKEKSPHWRAGTYYGLNQISVIAMLCSSPFHITTQPPGPVSLSHGLMSSTQAPAKPWLHTFDAHGPKAKMGDAAGDVQWHEFVEGPKTTEKSSEVADDATNISAEKPCKQTQSTLNLNKLQRQSDLAKSKSSKNVTKASEK